MVQFPGDPELLSQFVILNDTYIIKIPCVGSMRLPPLDCLASWFGFLCALILSLAV